MVFDGVVPTLFLFVFCLGDLSKIPLALLLEIIL